MTKPAGLKRLERERRSFDRAVMAERVARARLEAAMVDVAQAGASQREIAAAASVSQPYVQRVLVSRRDRFVPRSRLGLVLAARRQDVTDLLRSHGIEDVRVFGSVARGEDDVESDIDLAVCLPVDMGLFGVARVEQELEKLLGARVDLVPADALKPGVGETAARDMVPL